MSRISGSFKKKDGNDVNVIVKAILKYVNALCYAEINGNVYAQRMQHMNSISEWEDIQKIQFICRKSGCFYSFLNKDQKHI